jgi:hypothetical protein
MSNRYSDRVDAIVDYLDEALNTGTTDTYYITGKVSQANGTGGVKRVLLVFWEGLTNDLQRGLSEPSADTHRFSVYCQPVAQTDDDADEELNEMAEAVVDALRAKSSYAVLGDADGQPVGWRMTNLRKGPNRNGEMVMEINIEVLIEEDRQ